MAFEQAQIRVQKAEEFERLRSALDHIFMSGGLETFLKLLEKKNVGAREFEKIVASGVLEQVEPALAEVEKTAGEIYGSLPLSDQALMREFYLERLETVDPNLRLKYRKAFRYH